MTQKIKSWKEKVSIFFQNSAKKELEEKQTAKQSIIQPMKMSLKLLYLNICKEFLKLLHNGLYIAEGGALNH